MTIYGICKSCHNHLYLKIKAYTRATFYNEIGGQSKINCKRCGVTNTFTINQFKAKLPKRIHHAIIETFLIAIIITLCTYVISLNMWQTLLVLGIYIIPAFAYVLYTRRNYDAVLYFNKSKI